MKEIILNNENMMPALGLGTWLSAPGEVYNIVIEAIKSGYRHIDCAAVYENEKEIGDALTEVLSKNVVKREDLFITSKLWNNSHKAKDVIPALKKTLGDLQLEYLDLYLIHWPVAFKKECFFPEGPQDYLPLSEVPIIETYKEMEKACEMGLVKSLGVSNFSVKKLNNLVNNAHISPAVNQVEIHPYFQQKSLLEFCASKNIALTAYCPLGSSGRPANMKGENEPSLLENAEISKIADELDASNAQVILAWALQRGTIAIPKTVTPSRAIENYNAQKVELSSSQMKTIAKLDRGFRYVDGSFFTPEGSPYSLKSLWDE